MALTLITVLFAIEETETRKDKSTFRSQHLYLFESCANTKSQGLNHSDHNSFSLGRCESGAWILTHPWGGVSRAMEKGAEVLKGIPLESASPFRREVRMAYGGTGT